MALAIAAVTVGYVAEHNPDLADVEEDDRDSSHLAGLIAVSLAIFAAQQSQNKKSKKGKDKGEGKNG